MKFWPLVMAVISWPSNSHVQVLARAQVGSSAEQHARRSGPHPFPGNQATAAGFSPTCFGSEFCRSQNVILQIWLFSGSHILWLPFGGCNTHHAPSTGALMLADIYYINLTLKGLMIYPSVVFVTRRSCVIQSLHICSTITYWVLGSLRRCMWKSRWSPDYRTLNAWLSLSIYRIRQ